MEVEVGEVGEVGVEEETGQPPREQGIPALTDTARMAAGRIPGWGVGLAGGAILGLVTGMFLALALKRRT